jgi:tRNA A-37 threonylcarbamoyl transferase component Bud32
MAENGKSNNTLSGEWDKIPEHLIVEKIAEGGMGTVYKARSKKLKRDVALKVIHPALVHREEIRIRFLDEARALSQVEHPGVVAIYELIEEPLTIVMQFIDGRPLDEFLQERSDRISLESERILRLEIMREGAEAMSHVHRKGVVHRDFKPQNILIQREDDRPKILDFGICRPETERPKDSPLKTQYGALLGTLTYMAPEQRIIGGKIDNRTDIYSFGLVLYETVTGEPFFGGQGSSIDSFIQLIQDERFVLGRLELLPPTVDHIVKKCLRFRREERYMFMDNIVGALDLAIDFERRNLTGIGLPSRRSMGEAETLADTASEKNGAGVSKRVAKTLRASRSKKGLVGLGVALGILALLVAGAFLGKFIPLEGGVDRKKEGGPAGIVETTSRAVSAPSGPLEESIRYCKKVVPGVAKDRVNLVYCVRRRAWTIFKQGDDEKAETVAKNAIKFFWTKRRWSRRKRVAKQFVLLNDLLAVIYRTRQHREKKGSELWRLHADKAAAYEKTARRWRRKLKIR